MLSIFFLQFPAYAHCHADGHGETMIFISSFPESCPTPRVHWILIKSNFQFKNIGLRFWLIDNDFGSSLHLLLFIGRCPQGRQFSSRRIIWRVRFSYYLVLRLISRKELHYADFFVTVWIYPIQFDMQPNKKKSVSVKDKLNGNEIDLSLLELTEAPVKELVCSNIWNIFSWSNLKFTQHFLIYVNRLVLPEVQCWIYPTTSWLPSV